ncbi:MAG TPA: hypothetical protein VHM01_23955 [Alphaproteobacteria bacterium]|nr:hypothetical protein [Alphaproteobacteria bacterium]
MTTVISGDRVQRFAELDHAVMEEVRAIVEIDADDRAAEPRADATHRALRGLLTTLRASIRLFRAS